MQKVFSVPSKKGKYVANVLEIANEAADDKFIITLRASEDGVIVVQSIELIADFARTRISLSRRNRLDECFCPEVASELAAVLKLALEALGKTSLPDHAIRLSDVLLEGCRVIVTAASGGGENINLRFRKCYGAVFSVLNDSVPLKRTSSTGPWPRPSICWRMPISRCLT